MKHLITGILLVFSISVFAQEGTKNFIDQNYIEMTGKAQKEILPDQIYMKIMLNEKDLKYKTLSDAENAMMAKLNQLGIDVSKDLVVKDMISNFRDYWILKKDINLSKEYQLLVHNAQTAGKVIVALQQLGISDVSIEKTDNSKMKEYQNELRVEAIKNAQEEAKVYATAIGQNIGRALFIRENYNNLENPIRRQTAGIMVKDKMMTNGVGNDLSEPDINFEKIKLVCSVVVRFELK